MMLASHELARIFFAGESDEARIVPADAFDDCACLGAASIAIGVFDGVHRGHHELIDAVVRDARNHGCKAVVVTFDPDPDVVVSPSPAQKLMTTADRLHALALTGVDAVVAVPFTPAVAALDHVGFLKLLSCVVDIRSIRVGSDFRLGRGGASGVAEMQAWGAERGVDVYGHELLCVDGQTICATRIRQELRQGHVELAAELLGRPYMLRGIVAGVVIRVPTWVFPRQTSRCPRAFRCLPMASTRLGAGRRYRMACRRQRGPAADVCRRCRLGSSRGQLDRVCRRPVRRLGFAGVYTLAAPVARVRFAGRAYRDRRG